MSLYKGGNTNNGLLTVNHAHRAWGAPITPRPIESLSRNGEAVKAVRFIAPPFLSYIGKKRAQKKMDDISEQLLSGVWVVILMTIYALVNLLQNTTTSIFVGGGGVGGSRCF